MTATGSHERVEALGSRSQQISQDSEQGTRTLERLVPGMASDT